MNINIVVVDLDKSDNKVHLTKEELEKYLNEAYEKGYMLAMELNKNFNTGPIITPCPYRQETVPYWTVATSSTNLGGKNNEC